jgi:hypothetical protein
MAFIQRVILDPIAGERAGIQPLIKPRRDARIGTTHPPSC